MRDEATASDLSSRGPIASSPPTVARSFRARIAVSASAAASATSNGTTGVSPAIGSGTNARYRKDARARRPPIAPGSPSQVRSAYRAMPLPRNPSLSS